MDTVLLIVIVIAVVAYFLLGRSTAGGSSSTLAASKPASSTSPAPDNLDWLMEKWRQADKAHQAGQAVAVPKWFFDEATPRQLEKLASLNIRIGAGHPTKGKASDLIGLHYPIDESDLEVLKFFKETTQGMNQTKGRYRVQEVLADPGKNTQWENRPASQLQKECYRFFGLKVPAGLTIKEADATINALRKQAGDEHIKRLEEWDSYDLIISDLSNRDMLKEDFDMKKPSMVQIREAVEALVKDGQSLADMDAHDVSDKILEMKPDMSRPAPL